MSQPLADKLEVAVAADRDEAQELLDSLGEVPEHIRRYLQATIEVADTFLREDAQARCAECGGYCFPPPAYMVDDKRLCAECADKALGVA